MIVSRDGLSFKRYLRIGWIFQVPPCVRSRSAWLRGDDICLVQRLHFLECATSVDLRENFSGEEKTKRGDLGNL